VWLQKFGRRSKELGTILVMGDGFDGPEHIEPVREIHGFGVHQEEGCIERPLHSSLLGDFDLRGRDGDTSDGGAKFFGKKESAGAKTATDVEDVPVGFYVCELREMLDELKLCFFFGFIATNPIAVMQVFAPERAVVRTEDVVVLDDALFIIRTTRRERLIP